MTSKTAKIYSLVWGLKVKNTTWNSHQIPENYNSAYLRFEYGFITGQLNLKGKLSKIILINILNQINDEV